MSLYALAKTEDIAAERHFEEDAYAAALEWLEALGADIVSSSLGYREFDSSEVSYTAEQLDGRTTIVAQAVEAAARRGVLCVTAMGNAGLRGISSPADADSAIAVAAVDSTGRRAGFSSVGMWRGARPRPTLAALGVDVLALPPGADRPRPMSGTSMATPLISAAAALILAARPELAPWQIRRALCEAASSAEHPDTLIGYGVPDVRRALLRLGGAVGPLALVERAGVLKVVAYALVPFPLFGAWLQWATEPRHEALRGSIPLRTWGAEPVVLVGELPREVFRNGDTIWARVVLQGSSGEELYGQWSPLQLSPLPPCGMVVPEDVLALPLSAGTRPQLSAQVVPAGQECVVQLPGAYPGTHLPLRAVRLWDAVARQVREYPLPETAHQWGMTQWTLRLSTVGLAAGLYWLEALYDGARLHTLIVLY